MVNIEKRNWNRLYTVLSILFVLSAIVPLLAACRYAVPSADDFYGVMNVQYYEEQGNLKLVAACKVTSSVYLSQQGTFTGCFFYYLLSALIQVRIIPTRITLFIVVGLFLMAVYFCVYSFMRHILCREGYYFLINLVYGLSIYTITIGHNIKEVFYWICGACVYTVPLIFMFAGIVFAVRVLENGRRADIVTACLLCFLATGGTLQLAAFMNAVILGMGIWEYERNTERKILPVFLSSFVGALINVAAPGNYIRQNNIGADIDIILAVRNSAAAVMDGFEDLFRNSPLLLVMTICILAGSTRIFMKVYEMIGVVVYVILSLIIIDFPVMLAYGSLHIESRILFVQNIAIVTATLILAVCIGQAAAYALRKYQQIVNKRLLCSAVCILAAVVSMMLMYTGNYHKNDIMPLAICMNLANGNMKEFNDTNMEIFALLENGAGKDIVIEYYPSDMGILQPIKLQTDAEHWINTGVARYYGCNMVVLKE